MIKKYFIQIIFILILLLFVIIGMSSCQRKIIVQREYIKDSSSIIIRPIIKKDTIFVMKERDTIVTKVNNYTTTLYRDGNNFRQTIDKPSDTMFQYFSSKVSNITEENRKNNESNISVMRDIFTQLKIMLVIGAIIYGAIQIIKLFKK